MGSRTLHKYRKPFCIRKPVPIADVAPNPLPRRKVLMVHDCHGIGTSLSLPNVGSLQARSHAPADAGDSITVLHRESSFEVAAGHAAAAVAVKVATVSAAASLPP